MDLRITLLMVIYYELQRALLTSFLMAQQKAILMETLKEFQLEHLRVKHLAPLTAHCLVLLIHPNLENNLVVKNVYELVYLSALLKESLEVPFLDLLMAFFRIFHMLII